ncbi:MAG: AmmeMemoRadiSam system protein A [Bacteroidales bacterium]
MSKSKSPYTNWVREVLKSHFEGKSPLVPESEALNNKAGCFVSLHNPDGSLRGCIGTIMPTKSSLLEEIKANAVSAALHDPRFLPLSKEELEDLEISVDVLGDPEPVQAITQLDPKVYGVIVSAGSRRGVLLPDLPGVDKVEDQIHIAMQKAGIEPGTPISVERFKVKRYH